MFSIIRKYLPKPVELQKSTVKELKTVSDECHLLYNLVYGFLSKVTPDIKAKVLDDGELTDFGFLCRELAKLFDELRKECKARQELCGSIIAYNLTQQVIRDPSLSMKSKGELASGTPDVKMQVALPKKFTDEYFQLTDFFGVPREIAETGILRLDWKRVTELCTQLTQDGKPIPEGFGKKYPMYYTTFKKKRGG